MNKLKMIFGDRVRIIEEDNEKTVIDYGREYGDGSITIYDIMPGVILSFIDFNSESALHNSRGIKDIWEINYCVKGRFECEFSNDILGYLGEGDFAINSMEHIPKISSFPLKKYYGISIFIDINEIKTKSSDLLKLFSIDLGEINKKLSLDNQCYISKATPSINHIFTEIYENKENVDVNYIRIKFFELLYSLNTLTKDEIYEERYYTKNQVNKVKHIRDHMIEHDDVRFSLEELTEEHYISLSLFKSCFKKIYGDTPYSYIRKYKMNKAAILLNSSENNINDIAISLGYKNASKFSKAFQDVMGMLPSEYRKKNI